VIAYTIGHTKSYNQALKEDPNDCFKVGRTFDYQGGWVWKTKEEAQAFIVSEDFLKVDWGDCKPRDPKNFSVYGLVLANGWDKDVIEEEHNYLLHDSKFFSLESI
jgi:hypothetical protein